MAKNWHILTNGYFSTFYGVFSAKNRRFENVKKLYLNCIFKLSDNFNNSDFSEKALYHVKVLTH